jgi:ribosome maturation factor RimP
VSSAKQDAVRDRIEAELGDPLSALALDIEAVEVTPAGKRRIVRVAVDKDGGVTLDDVADATRAVSAVLDDSDVLGEMPYTLEVTSRGVDRPLTLPRHWRRNADRLVKVTLTDGTVLTGRVTGSDDHTVMLAIDDATREVAYADITRALVQIEFNRKGRPPAAADEPDENDEHDDDEGEA